MELAFSDLKTTSSSAWLFSQKKSEKLVPECSMATFFYMFIQLLVHYKICSFFKGVKRVFLNCNLSFAQYGKELNSIR